MAMEIEFNNVSADYKIRPLRTSRVLYDINLKIPPSSFVAIVGKTGAGKSSLLKTMNGLLLPKEGFVNISEMKIQQNTDKKTLKQVRKKVGMVLQFPESQLFAETVEKDISFGPLNYGASPDEAKKLARASLHLVGLSPDFLSKSPFTLSGGQKRRVAIAGILALKPEILLLDEPGVGLDPEGKQEIFQLLKNLNQHSGISILFVTHDMNEVARYAEDVIVMKEGRNIFYGNKRKLFADPDQLTDMHLDVPDSLRFQRLLEKKIGKKLPKVCLTEEELADCLIEAGYV